MKKQTRVVGYKRGQRKLKVYVEDNNRAIQEMFRLNGGYKTVTNYKQADLICFSGGADVNPVLYGESGNKKLSGPPNYKRDSRCIQLFKWAVTNNKPCIGICRGAQFLTVVNGGRLWQDVDNHAISGTHVIEDSLTHEIYEVTSTHHQMMRPPRNANIIAYATESTVKRSECQEVRSGDKHRLLEDTFDAEVVLYDSAYVYKNPDWGTHRSLAFQGHPEYATCPAITREYFFNLIEEYLVDKEKEGVTVH